MTIYLQIFFACFLIFCGISSADDRLDMKTRGQRRLDLVDLTRGLSDAEIESALSDLTLADLKALSQLVDASNSGDYDYEDDSISNVNAKKRNFESDDADQNDAENDDDIDEPAAIRESRNFMEFKIPRAALAGENLETQRAKRENAKLVVNDGAQGQRIKRENVEKAISVDEDYLKQLENSFPRDQQQPEELDDKKDHIRVKRN